ncbi:MAG TPA: type IV pilus assembly protein PilM [Candidatus Moranbacteria bacterium]|nr:type IV pilus assembly protein PilM [Candidatus Moranbacteria bacterium]
MSFFTKNIISFDDKFCAVDLSDLSVKIFQLEKDGRIDRVRGYAHADIPEGFLDDGRIMEKNKVAEIIKAAMKKTIPKKINTRKVICSIPESKAFLRIISIPKVNEEEAREAIKWEMEANIPLSSDQVYFDWQFLEEAGGKQNVLTAAVSKEIVDDTVEVLGLAGLEVYGMEVESIASVRSLIPFELSKEVFLIVDIGARRTSFIISEGNLPSFTSSIPFSSEVISDSISKSLNIDKKEADKIKINQGIEHSFEENSIFNIIKPMLENLATEIEKTIDFYGGISKGSLEIKKIILCGGGSNLRGIVPYLTTRLCKDVMLGDPWVNLNFGNNLPIIDKNNSIKYTTAIGLALKGIKHGS